MREKKASRQKEIDASFSKDKLTASLKNQTTSTHIKEISFTKDKSGAVWAYDPQHCFTDVVSSASK